MLFIDIIVLVQARVRGGEESWMMTLNYNFLSSGLMISLTVSWDLVILPHHVFFLRFFHICFLLLIAIPGLQPGVALILTLQGTPESLPLLKLNFITFAGSRGESEVAGFFVFSHIRMIGQVRQGIEEYFFIVDENKLA